MPQDLEAKMRAGTGVLRKHLQPRTPCPDESPRTCQGGTKTPVGVEAPLPRSGHAPLGAWNHDGRAPWDAAFSPHAPPLVTPPS